MPSAISTLDARSEDRVRKHTAASVNAKIDRETRASIEQTLEGGHDAIVARLKELDREWDVDRALMANFAVLGTIAHELGLRVNRGWHFLLRAQLGFLMMHAVIGWCPPLPILRRLGFRTAKEIATERAALMARLGSAPSG